MLEKGLSECPNGAEVVTKADCQEAFDEVKLKYNLENKRPLKSGGWIHVPRYCTVSTYDDTPHFNTIDLSNAFCHSFRKVCRNQCK